MKLLQFRTMLNATWLEIADVTGVKSPRLSAVAKGKLPTTQELIQIHNGTEGCVSFRDLVGDMLDH